MRKLATASVAFSAAIYASNYLLPSGWLIAMAVFCAAGAAALALLRRKQLRLLAAALLFFSAGLLCFFFHNRSTVEKAASYDGQIHRLSVQVLDYPDVYDDYSRLDVRITSAYLPSFKAVLYDNDMQLCTAHPGDTVELSAKLSLADSLYDEAYDGYYSKGIYFKLSSRGDVELSRGFNIFSLPQYVSRWLSERIERIFPGDTEVFMRSLLLGDKGDFYSDKALYSAVSRAGLMHIMAVSGMHISFLVGLLHFVLGEGRRSALICIVLIWFFALVTGAGPSVLRASFMYTTVLMAPVLKRENDPVTSMSVILALILCVNPFAAASISLQLSFGAMAGILCFSKSIYRAAAGKLKAFAGCGFGRYVLSSFACSLSVMAFTIPLTALHFGTVALMAPVTNLVSLWAVSLCFCGGWISCVLSFIPFAGEISAWICSWFARYVIFAAQLISSVPFAVLYMQTKGAWLWLGLSYGLFILLYICGLRAFALVMIPSLVSLLLVAALIWGNTKHYGKTDSMKILDVGQGQCISIQTDEASVIIDCGNISSIENAGETAVAELYSRGQNKVDALILSHLHEDHANGAVMLMEMLDVKQLIIPRNHDDSDELYDEIAACAERNGTELIKVIRDSEYDFGDVKVKLIRCGMGKEDDDENERCLIASLDINDYEVLVMADATADMERKLCEKEELEIVDVLVVSHHGSKYSSSEELLQEIGGGVAVISVGNNYYGHPAEETLEALETYGYNVYRTDEQGGIEFKIGNNYG